MTSGRMNEDSSHDGVQLPQVASLRLALPHPVVGQELLADLLGDIMDLTSRARDRRKAANRKRERERYKRNLLAPGEKPYPAHAGEAGRYKIMLLRLR